MNDWSTLIAAAALLWEPTLARTKAKAVVDGVEYSVTVENHEAIASRTGLRLWADRVGDWRKAVSAIEQVSGCTAQHVAVVRAHNGGVPVGVRALLDCEKAE